MRFPFAVAVLAVTALALSADSAAHAQIISAYALSANTKFSNVVTNTTISPTGTYSTQYATYWASGIGGGVTLNVLPVGPLQLGVDLRGSARSGAPGDTTGMLGFRAGVKVPIIKIKPYLQASGGYVETRTAVTTSPATGGGAGTLTSKYAGYEIFGGVDYPVAHFVDIRAIEIGYGKAYNTDGSDYAIQQISLFSINAGIVVHF